MTDVKADLPGQTDVPAKAGPPAKAGGRGLMVIAAARGLSVTFGGPLVLDIAAAMSVTATARAVAGRTRPSLLAVAGTAATVAYVTKVRPRLRQMGATPVEAHASLPGDDLVPRPGITSTRAVTIDAAVDDVWPWLAQIGQDRGGFYSYAWLENAAGCRMRNADRIHPEWQHRDVGETVLLHPSNGLPVALFEPKRVLALTGWGSFVLEPVDYGRTRLIVRSRVPRGFASIFYAALVEIPHVIMERKMLLGIKQRAEQQAPYPTGTG